MDTMLHRRPPARRRRASRRLAAGAGLLLALVASSQAHAQPQPPTGPRSAVTGTVTSAGGAPLLGVAVRVENTDLGTFTNAAGKYTLSAPRDGTLIFTLIGQRPVREAINGRATIDVQMERVSILEEVVVTGYTEGQRRAEVTGAVASVNTAAVERQTSASVLQRLAANVSGVTVENSGSPGSRSTVRIRGISSFQNNDPLYIIDGTPVQDSYVNWLNPDDVETIQVLKDASAASIYGSRASNGVVIIETKKGRAAAAPRTTLRARTGITSAVKGYDDFLITNALDYFQVVKQSYLNAGYSPSQIPVNIYGDVNNPQVPAYIWPNNCNPNPCKTVDASAYSYPTNLIMPGSAGTNWWKAVFGNGFVGDYNLDVAGGGTGNTYNVSFNYFDQKGTAAYNRFDRGSVRVNTSFNRGRFYTGENIALTGDRANGGLANDPGGYAEDGILGKNILMQPVIPVRDIAGNFASGKAVGLGNQSNPLGFAYGHKNDIQKNARIFGNAYGGFDITPKLNLRSTIGVNMGNGTFTGYSPITPENSEPNFTNGINENQNSFQNWTWSNTLRYSRSFFWNQNVNVLVGQEANRSTNRFLSGSLAALINNSLASRYIQDALGDASTKNVSSSGGRSALLSYFGKIDYNLKDRYLLTATVRRDGSSNLSPDNRWGTFPAFGFGWRVSEEPFFPKDSKLFSDVRLRGAWGVTGNQQIPGGRIVSSFGGSRGDTYYDISGSNSSVVAGFRQTSIGNGNLKWEENRSQNVGLDLGLWNGSIEVVFDVYERKTNNLLFNPALPGTAGVASSPIVNIGKMKNTGIDFSIGHRAANWSINVNGSHYRNTIVSIDGVTDFFQGPVSTRFGNQVINKVGQSIGSFYGYKSAGFFKDAADVASWAKQDGAAPGRIKFVDTNGDGKVTLADRVIIGNPNPDFTGGVDLSMRRGAFEVSTTVFGSFGNDIFDVQKEFYVFRNFSTNVRKDLLTDSWTPEHQDAKYPRLDVNDTYSRAVSDYYVESGSYVRMTNLQVAYDVPQRYARFLTNARVYVQAENLFTITGYNGLDPALPAAAVTGAAGDIRDQYRGVDRGTYPNNRTFSFGIITSF